MKGRIFLGILCLIYGTYLCLLAYKRPDRWWKSAKTEAYKKVLGDKPTLYFFYLWAGLAWIIGLWLLGRSQFF